jgi:2,4-dienoyl-CoA reductase-like NADH-dependent reductase (Old Yellow Enzyme family)/thioredoxin reductase
MTASPHPRYPHVFSPLKLGPVEVPTRFFFAPHGSALSAGTKPTDDLVAYSAERVRGGGCGLVVVALVQHERGRTRQPSPHPPENIAAFTVLTDAIHAAGGKIFGQCFYHWIGAGAWQPFSPPAPALAPSVRQFGLNDRSSSTHAMGQDEIAGMVAAMRQTCANMAAAGFDGILLHGSHAALIEQFLSPWFNERQDEYGGSLENRMRLMCELLAAAREGGGSDFAVGIRLNCDEQITGGYGVDTMREVVAVLCARGLVDYIDLDVGLEPQQFHHGIPSGFVAPHYYRPWVEQVRSAATVPVLSVLGHLTDMAVAEAAIADGTIDMAGCARQLIAEPQFVQNARNGMESRNRICIACNWCTASMGDGAMGCTINPASYRERLWGVDSWQPAPAARRVVIVGGGPGGMEAARSAALRGHRVTLFEARDALGGALALWGQLPGRENYAQPITWWAAELARLGVDVRLGAAARVDSVLAEAPDAVIVATGARYSLGGRSIHHDGDLPGHDLPHVLRPEEILRRGARPGGRVLVIDGEGLHAGTGLAELLAQGGAEVTLVSAGFSPLSPRLVDNFEGRFIVARLKAAGVRFAPTSWVRAIHAGGVTLRDMHTDEERQEPADAVVLVTGREPKDGLAESLAGKVPQLFTIGDALAARMLAAATYEGQMFARLIGEPGAPTTMAETYFRPDHPSVNPLPADIGRPV